MPDQKDALSIITAVTAQDLILSTPTRTKEDMRRLGLGYVPPNSSENGALDLLADIRDISAEYLVRYGDKFIKELPKGFNELTPKEARALDKPDARKLILAGLIARDEFTKKLAAGLKTVETLGDVASAAESYQQINALNPYTDTATRLFINTAGTLAEWRVRFLVSELFGYEASTAALSFAAAGLGIPLSPVVLTAGGITLAVGISYFGVERNLLPLLRARTLHNLPVAAASSPISSPGSSNNFLRPNQVLVDKDVPSPANTFIPASQPSTTAPVPASTPAATVKTPQSMPSKTNLPQPTTTAAAHEKLGELFPSQDPLANQANWVLSPPPPHIDPEKFKPQAINVDSITVSTTHNDMVYSVGISNPIGGMFFVAQHAKSLLTWLTASTKERAEMKLRGAIRDLATADDSNKPRYLKYVETAAQEYAEINKHAPQPSFFGKVLAHAAKMLQANDIIGNNTDKMTKDFFAHYLQRHDEALQHLQKGDLPQAEKLADEVYIHAPELPQAAILRAQVLQQQGRAADSNYFLTHAESIIGQQAAAANDAANNASPEMRAWTEKVDPAFRARNLLQEKIGILRIRNLEAELQSTNQADQQKILRSKILGEAQKLTQKRPHNINYQRALASAYRQFGNTTGALTVEAAICNLSDCNETDLAHYSDSLIATGDFSKAEKILKKYLTIKPQDEIRQKQLITCRLHNPNLNSVEEQQRTVELLEGYVKKNPRDTDYANALVRIHSHAKMVQGTCTTAEAAAMASVSFSKEGTVDDLRLMVAILQQTEGQQSAQDAVKHFNRVKNPTSYTELSALVDLSTELNDRGTALAILQPHLTKADCPAEITARYDQLMKEKGTELCHKANTMIPQALALYRVGEVVGKYAVRTAYYGLKHFTSSPPPKSSDGKKPK